jgi:hypothetical protein
MSEKNNPGEDKAWEILATLSAEDVCRSATASYDALSQTYTVLCYGMAYSLCVRNRTIASTAPGGDLFLKKLGYFFRLSVLWYLVHAKNIACTDRLVKLETVTRGDIFTKGSHVLPLDIVAKKYAKDKSAFIGQGEHLGGKPAKYGDASIQLFPLPKVPVVLALWLEDEEFPARADILFDSTCDLHLPMDVLWSIAMMTVLAMA